MSVLFPTEEASGDVDLRGNRSPPTPPTPHWTPMTTSQLRGAYATASQQADFITAYACLCLSLQFLALTETWITPENTVTPAALSSSFSFSHTSSRGGGTGLLISPSWTFSGFPLTNLSPSTFEYHSVLITHPLTCTLQSLTKVLSLIHFVETTANNLTFN